MAGIFAEAAPEAKPVVAPIAYTAPVVVDAPVVTATSSQFISRNYNGIAAPLVGAPLAYTSAYYTPYAYAVDPVAPLKYRSVVSAEPLKYTSAAVIV